jgi:hypothetical protein
MSLATFLFSLAFQGSRAKEEMSGLRTMSDSWILANPSMEEPSKAIPESRAFPSLAAGIETLFTSPWMSVNCNRRNSTFLSRMVSNN